MNIPQASEILKKQYSIPDNLFKDLLEISRIKIINKGDCFIHEGDIPGHFAFVLKGLFRYFYIDKNGNIFTKGFFPEFSVISAYSAMIEKRGSYFTIEALENSEILVVDYFEWKKMSDIEIYWKNFLIALLEKGYCTKEAREREFLLCNAEERYKIFLKIFPGLEKRVKQHIIASYLGITSVALSRTRKKINSLNPG